MKCEYCNDTGKWRKPNDQEKFDYYCDHFPEGDFCSQSMAEEKAYKKVGYTIVDCPHCKAVKTKEKTANE